MNHKAIETLAGSGKSKGPMGGLGEPGTPSFSASFCPCSIHKTQTEEGQWPLSPSFAQLTHERAASQGTRKQEQVLELAPA